MRDRRKTEDVLWLAFQYAKQDRAAIIDAYHGNTKEMAVKNALKDIAAIERLQKRLFRTTKSKMEAALEGGTTVNIFNLRELKKVLNEYI